MGIYTDQSTILGVRILIAMPQSSYDYILKHEFTGKRWKDEAVYILPHYLGKSDVKIQTLHYFTSSHNIQTGQVVEPTTIWLDNFNFKLEDLINV